MLKKICMSAAIFIMTRNTINCIVSADRIKTNVIVPTFTTCIDRNLLKSFCTTIRIILNFTNVNSNNRIGVACVIVGLVAYTSVTVMIMFNEKLCYLRKHQELTQAELAERLKINSATYSKYEQGISEPDIATIKSLANFFDVSIDYLLENEKATLEAMDTVDFETLIFHGNYKIKSKFPTDKDRKMIQTIVNAIFGNK